MRRLPLYGDRRTAAERVEPAPVGAGCQRCDRGASGDFRKPTGKVGGALLLFGMAPTKGGGHPAHVQDIVGQAKALGPVAVDYAIRCSGRGILEDHEEACRGLTATVLAKGWDRVLCFGSAAHRAVLGTSAPTHDVRRCWSTLADGTPVYALPWGRQLFDNRFHTRWLIDDVRWAMTARADAPKEGDVRVVETVEDAEAALEWLGRGPVFLDTETFGRIYDDDFRIVALALARVDDERVVWVWPDGACHPDDPRGAMLRRLEADRVEVWIHNAEFDLRVVRRALGLDLEVGGDTMMLSRLLAPHEAGYLSSLAWKVGMGGLKDEMGAAKARATRVLNLLRREAAKEVAGGYDYEVRTVKRKDGTVTHQRRKVAVGLRPPTLDESRAALHACWNTERSIDKVRRTPAEYLGHSRPLLGELDAGEDWYTAAIKRAAVAEPVYAYGLVDQSIVLPYCARDVASGARLARSLIEQVARDEHEPQRRLLDSHVRALPKAVSKIEDVGMLIDHDRLNELERFLDVQTKEVTRVIHDRAPGLDPGSDDQVRALLFTSKAKGGLGFTPTGMTKKAKKPSVNSEALQTLAREDEWVSNLLAYRELTKLQSNYARGIRRFITDDGRIHPNFNIAGAESGRFTCSDPNLQTIPSRSALAYRVKELFIPPPGYQIVQMDYSTLELRIAAMLSGDKVMLDAFHRGLDLHRKTAEDVSLMLWGSPFDSCSSEDQASRRKVAKLVNFASVYGQHYATLAFNTGLSLEDAKRAQEIIMGNYPGLLAWIADTIRRASRTGVTWTWWAGGPARCRAVPAIGSSFAGDVSHGQRQAYNTPVQGTGAEYCTASLAHLVPFLEREGIDARICLTVHDSIVGFVAEGDVDEYVYHGRRIMTQWDSAGVPILVDAEAGPDWAHLSAV